MVVQFVVDGDFQRPSYILSKRMIRLVAGWFAFAIYFASEDELLDAIVRLKQRNKGK